MTTRARTPPAWAAWLIAIVTGAALGLSLAAAIAGVFNLAAAGGVPEACRMYQRTLERQAFEVFGPNAPVAVLAAQVQAESACRPDARSGVGAIGLTQFMPATARDLALRYPKALGPADPGNWKWAIAAQVRYMHELTAAVQGRTECDDWAFGLSGYNGGAGWRARDQAVCRAKPVDVAHCRVCLADEWWGSVADTPDRRRAPANVRQNRTYVDRILLRLLPNYTAADYPGGFDCAAAAAR
ncbi:MAG TPA: transglycosylase SLT domain-containing protein [Rhodanobacteraceae bacterium]|nr:transglycosylase SLT domain-containing protein [Rhodanobacteraceae bacterium]